jgi:hypothetical protein
LEYTPPITASGPRRHQKKKAKICSPQSYLKQEEDLAAYGAGTPTTVPERQQILADRALARWHVDVPEATAAHAPDAEEAASDFEDDDGELTPDHRP